MALAEVGARLRLQGADAYRRDATRAADATDRLGREAQQTDRRLGGLSGAARRAGSALGSIGRAGALGGLGAAAVGIGALSVGLVQGFKDAAALQTLMAKTGAVIKSTGGAAHVSAKGVLNLADELESLSGIDGDAIINAQNLLLTFTQVKNGTGELNHVFDQATKTAVDMAAALGSDPSAAAMQLGKALNDPIKGVGALGKVGVSFTAQQKKTIKSLVDGGKVMDAQKIILKELQVEFGGAAKAAGSGFEGSMARAKDAIGDLFRDVATPLLPVVTKQIERFSRYVNDELAPAMVTFADGFVNGTGKGGEFRDRMEEVWPKLKKVGEQAKFVLDKMGALVGWMIDHETAVKTFAAAIAAYAVAVKALAVAGAAAAAVKWVGLATGIITVGAAAGTAGAAGGGLAIFGASLTSLVAVGGPVALAIAAFGALAWAIKEADNSAASRRNYMAGVPTVTTTKPKTPKSITLNGVTRPVTPVVEVVPSRPNVATPQTGRRTSNLVGAGAGGSGSPVVVPAPNVAVYIGNKQVTGVVKQEFRDEAARR